MVSVCKIMKTETNGTSILGEELKLKRIKMLKSQGKIVVRI